MKRWWVVFAAVTLAVGIGLVGSGLLGLGPLYRLRDPIRCPLHEVELSDRLVTTEGTAHYPIRVKLNIPGTLFRQERNVWVYPLFEKGDTLGRNIRYLVSTPVPPDELAGFEDRTLTARVAPPTNRRLNRETLQAFLLEGYDFAEELLVLEEIRDS